MNTRVYIAVLLGILTLVVTPAAHAVDCGDTIPAGSKVTLDPATDFTSGTCSGAALTIVGPATVDMAGTKIFCSGAPGTLGIVLAGSAVKLSNGVIRGCAAGVTAGPPGGHKISRVVVEFSDVVGIWTVSDGNRLTENVVTFTGSGGGAVAGIRVVGSGNKLTGNIVSDVSGQAGVLVEGAETKLKDNRVVGSTSGINTPSCYEVGPAGAGTKFKGDVATACANGFKVDGDAVKINKCSVLGSETGIAIGAALSVPTGIRVTKSTIGGNLVGIEMYSSADGRIKKNLVLGNGTSGLFANVNVASGSGNVISGNTFIGHTTDIEDLGSPPCSNNYSKNVFASTGLDPCNP